MSFFAEPGPASSPSWHPVGLIYLEFTWHLQNDWMEALHTAARVGASQGRMSASYLPEHVLTTASIGFGRPHRPGLGSVPIIENPEQLQRLLLLMMPSKVLTLPDPETALSMSRHPARKAVAPGTDAVITALEEMHRSGLTIMLSCAFGHQHHLE